MSVEQGSKYDRESMEEHSGLHTDQCEPSGSFLLSGIYELIAELFERSITWKELQNTVIDGVLEALWAMKQLLLSQGKTGRGLETRTIVGSFLRGLTFTSVGLRKLHSTVSILGRAYN